MASWEHACPSCKKKFSHSLIDDTLESYFFPIKPNFPDEGIEFECPNCGHKSNYQRTDLTFKA
jgi:rubredoxin